MEETFLKVDSLIKEEDFAQDTGSTACVVLITKDEIVCSNAGDSRAVLFTNN